MHILEGSLCACIVPQSRGIFIYCFLLIDSKKETKRIEKYIFLIKRESHQFSFQLQPWESKVKNGKPAGVGLLEIVTYAWRSIIVKLC